MDIRYVPFLKSKQNEIHALAEVEPNLMKSIVPFFDFPKKQNGDTGVNYELGIQRLVKKFKKYLKELNGFYFDIYDIDDDITVSGLHIYEFLLKEFSSLPIIPVVSIDRSELQKDSVNNVKTSGALKSNVVAFRVTHEDFQNFEVIEEDVEDMLNDTFSLFSQIDLVFDCRICSTTTPSHIAKQIALFSSKFQNKYNVRNIIVTGSSIPASVAEILSSHSEESVHRMEIDIFTNLRSILDDGKLVFGDYTIISPDYSDADIPPEQMQNRITAKLTYSFDKKHYFIRGGSLKTKGRDQYYDLASTLCGKHFFRNSNSSGDNYFEEKSRREGGQCYVNTVIKPAINSHVTYMMQRILTNSI